MFIRAPVLAGYSSVMVMTAFLAFLSLQGSERVPIPTLEPTKEEAAQFTVGELLARMPDEPWEKGMDGWTLKTVPAEMQRRVESGVLTDNEWRQALSAADVIHTRSRWPVAEPLGAWIHAPLWLPRTRIVVTTVTPNIGEIRADDMNPSWCGTCQGGRMARLRELAFGPLPSGTRGVDVVVTIDQSYEHKVRWDPPDGERRLWTGNYRIPVEAVASLEQAMPSCPNSSETTAIKTTLAARWWSDPDPVKPPILYLKFGGSYDALPTVRGLAAALSVDLVHDGVVVSTTVLQAAHGHYWMIEPVGMTGYGRMESIPAELAVEGADLSGWNLRVTGTSDGVLNVWEAGRWWTGNFVLPLADAFQAPELK